MLNKLVLAGPTLVLAASVLLPVLDAAGAPASGLAWESSNGYRAAPVTVPPSAKPGFTLLAGDKTGIHFTNTLSYDKSVANQNFLNGAGVAAGDYDGDGWPDLYFCNLEGSNKLYRNRGDCGTICLSLPNCRNTNRASRRHRSRPPRRPPR